MRVLLPVFLLLVWWPELASAQLGGSRTYTFLTLPPSARVAALGGSLIPVVDDDVHQVMFNPATLNPSMHNKLGFSTALYFADINFGYAGFARHAEKWNTTFAGGIQYISYGELERMNIQGFGEGMFKAGEYALMVSGSRTYERFRYGATMKVIISSMERYSSLGLAMDAGVTYKDSTGRFMAGLVVRNLGTQLTTYTPDNREPLPLDIQIGIARQLEHLPVRFTAVFHHIQQFDIRYDDPALSDNQNNLFSGDTTTVAEKSYTIDKIARHVIVGSEFLMGKNFRLRVGYNHQRRQELKLSTRSGLTGFSMGFGFKINRFTLDYGLSRYHLAGASHQFTLSTNLSDFISGLN